MTKNSNPIDVEPNRYVDGRRRGRSWGDSKTHLAGFVPLPTVSVVRAVSDALGALVACMRRV
jgi:hypothetical protein